MKNHVVTNCHHEGDTTEESSAQDSSLRSEFATRTRTTINESQALSS
jgi:hypothetical protein